MNKIIKEVEIIAPVIKNGATEKEILEMAQRFLIPKNNLFDTGIFIRELGYDIDFEHKEYENDNLRMFVFLTDNSTLMRKVILRDYKTEAISDFKEHLDKNINATNDQVSYIVFLAENKPFKGLIKYYEVEEENPAQFLNEGEIQQ